MKLTVAIQRENRFPVLLVLLISFAFCGCATKVPFQNSTVEPAAVGKVKVKKDKNNNYTMQVYVEHLGAPNRLTPPRDIYVVWVQTPDNANKNVGRIVMGTSMFSKELTGSLTTVLLYRPKKVFITAEPEGQTENPGEPMVLTTESF